MVPQSRQRYGKALQLLSTALRDQKDLKKDSTLATVLCLGIYEVFVLSRKSMGIAKYADPSYRLSVVTCL